MHQPVVSLAAEALSRGEWVHVFPEAKINYDGRLGRLRWGAGKLLCEAHVRAGGRDPIVLPFFHSGMGRVLPLRARGFGVGHEVVVLVGEWVDGGGGWGAGGRSKGGGSFGTLVVTPSTS